MHISDGVLKPEVWIPLAAVSAAAVGIAARAAKKRFDDENIAVVGVMGAYVFALQMLNFPIGREVSDHIVGAALLAIVFGPGIALLAMAAIVTIQALVFVDGGVTALGANVFDMGILSTVAAYALYRALKGAWPNAAVVVATMGAVLAGAAGAAIWVILSGMYGVKFFGLMMGLHTLSGIVEAIVTLATVKALQKAGLMKRATAGANGA